jgi:hypothetical protein
MCHDECHYSFGFLDHKITAENAIIINLNSLFRYHFLNYQESDFRNDKLKEHVFSFKFRNRHFHVK